MQSAKLNGKTINRPWLKHTEILSGGLFEFQMGNQPNKEWRSAEYALPLSMVDEKF